MRLRSLTEAECYARCYGGRRDDRVTLVRLASDGRGDVVGAGRLQELLERRLETRREEPDLEAA